MPKTWMCPECDMENDDESMNCEMCEFPKPGTGKPAELVPEEQN